MGRHSQMSIENKLLLYKTILRPIWTYGIPLWGMASQSNITTLQRFQNKVLRTTVNAPWYIPNRVLHTDLLISTVREEVTKHGITHKDKLIRHTNQLIPILLEEQGPKRLKRYNTHTDSLNPNLPRKWYRVESVYWNTTHHARSLPTTLYG